MKEHRKYIIWAKSLGSSEGWRIAVEADDWDNATRAFRDAGLSITMIMH
jgi:hypothetical protein